VTLENEFANLSTAEAIDLIAARYGDREALVFGDRRYSFSDIVRESSLASIRLHEMGIRAGDKISIWLPNCPEFLWCLLGAARIGAVAVVLNTKLRSEEIAYQIDQSDSRCVVSTGRSTFRAFLDDIASLAPSACRRRPAADGSPAVERLAKLEFVVSIDECAAQHDRVIRWNEIPAGQDAPPLENDPNSPALIAYTSGTTALPKGVVLTHCIWRKGFDAGTTMGLSGEDKLYLCVPLYGMMGLITNGPLSWWTHGAPIVLEERYDLDRFFTVVERERCSVIQLMPMVMAPIMDDPRFKSIDRSRWRLATVLSSHSETLRLAVQRMGFRQVVCGYGLTETSAIVTRTRHDDPLDVQVGSNGRPLPDVAIKIVDPETGGDRAFDEPGEICLKGYFVMREYYRKPAETREAFTGDGWFRTGDLGLLDRQGNLHFKGRLKDGFKSKGFNVSAVEVEHAIREHAAVKDVAVVGVPHAVFGETGVAFVIVKAAAAVTEAEIQEHCRKRLASFKTPSRVLFVSDFPMTGGTDKVQKYQLKQMAMSA